jgi:hypothetical protein
MTARRIYGFLMGLPVGAWPFTTVALMWPRQDWLGWVALAIAAALTATAARTPAAWLSGLLAGVLSGWGAFAVLLDSDWRLLAYVVVGSWLYYPASITSLILAHLYLMNGAPTPQGPGAAVTQD